MPVHEMYQTRKCGGFQALAYDGETDALEHGKGMDETMMDVHGQNELEGSHQICSFMWAGNYWILSQTKEHAAQNDERIGGRSGKMGHLTQASQSAVDQNQYKGGEAGYYRNGQRKT